MIRRSRLARVLVTLATLSALLLACSHSGEHPASAQPNTPEAPAAPPAAPQDSAPAVCGDVTQLPRRDKLAQLLMVGVRDAADARAVVTDHHVGGIFVGSWTDLSMLNDGSLTDITGAAGPWALAVSVDEEGGRVSRLSSLIGSSPSARVLAQTKTPDEVYGIARDRGQKMRNLGITVDFAPDVDLSDAADDTVIGDRSFGTDPATVAEFAGAYARGLHDAGVTPVFKHFPGHGHASGDSHTGGVSTPPLEQLKADDLVPYQSLVTQPGAAVMIGHMQVPGLTGDDPASLSPAAVNLLRSGGYGGPGFGGVIYTDDLSSMAAISSRFGVGEAVLRALQAGVDVALWVTTDEVPAVLDHLEQAMDEGTLSMQAVDAAAGRVVAAKGPGPACTG
ncbi:glycoside hydrolase family 3 protein [Mycobacterium koreense]|uniref:beta-N-acetylhexosaminidase n=1 Tax=Mycolicibacillus koreensis TaxID=1069220 RepID=A0A7I7SFM3_9MYCO|nr:glycoside hydrolase family 3 N-terminal domain-containing protein [Mycolicibacillus koreensis]MCV7248636.1 glycoside hydrolase family 3 protein [Mycolicibacillus koreensis]ODR11871.1 beta-glucosidase [Mycolicibacillus koreensis]OSC34008.1 beta-glucosidase [Mycolicibacillus koreensis]BBY55598.1 glycosyl hydrolase [Mycolicibacillus koreensis]